MVSRGRGGERDGKYGERWSVGRDGELVGMESWSGWRREGWSGEGEWWREEGKDVKSSPGGECRPCFTS